MGRRLIMLGPPGAGKGTQAERVARAIGVPHLSTGEMLRSNVAEGTELGRRAKEYMDAGELVPDDLVIAMVDARLREDDAACGFLLDGYPRNETQADAIDAATADDPVELVVYVDVAQEELIARLMGRGRVDDTEEVVLNRLDVYRQETEPLIRRYDDQGLLHRVDGAGQIGDIFARIAEVLAS